MKHGHRLKLMLQAKARATYNSSMWVRAVLWLCVAAICEGQSSRWSEAAANAWYSKQPWLVGSNYIPSNAVNQLEMWQADTFDPARIDTKLGWADRTSTSPTYGFTTFFMATGGPTVRRK
jgi:hypothetical protein